MKIYWVDQLQKGKIGMSTRPRGGEWLEIDIQKLVLASTDILVSLLNHSEIKELKLETEKTISHQLGIEYINYEIEDRHVPESLITFKKLIFYLHGQLLKGKTIVIHCKMGIGRTSIVSASLLSIYSSFYNDVFTLLSNVIGLTVPDIEEQKQWTLEFIESLNYK